MVGTALNGQIQKKIILCLNSAYFIAAVKKNCNLLYVLEFVIMS